MKNFDEETIYNPSRKEERIKRDITGVKYEHGNEDARLLINKIRGFLKDNVNRPYYNVFADFCGKFPPTINREDTRWWFNYYVNKDNSQHFYRYGDFYVDDNNIIRRVKHHRDKNKVLLKDGEYKYQLKKAIFNIPEIKDYFVRKMNKIDIENMMDEKFVSPDLFNKFEKVCKDSSFWREFSEILKKCSANHNDILKKYHIYYSSYNISNINIFTFLHKVIIKDAKYIVEGTPEYNRYFAELRQKNKKQEKEKNIIKEEKVKKLLNDIEAKRKYEKHKTDEIDRDRLGFNEESFYGEFYHGEKRKKKN